LSCWPSSSNGSTESAICIAAPPSPVGGPVVPRSLAQPIRTIFRHRLIETGTADWVAVCPQNPSSFPRSSAMEIPPRKCALAAQQLQRLDRSGLPALGSFEAHEYPKPLPCRRWKCLTNQVDILRAVACRCTTFPFYFWAPPRCTARLFPRSPLTRPRHNTRSARSYTESTSLPQMGSVVRPSKNDRQRHIWHHAHRRAPLGRR